MHIFSWICISTNFLKIFILSGTMPVLGLKGASETYSSHFSHRNEKHTTAHTAATDALVQGRQGAVEGNRKWPEPELVWSLLEKKKCLTWDMIVEWEWAN